MGINDQAKERRKLSLDEAIAAVGTYFEFDPIEVITLQTERGEEDFEVSFNSVWSLEQIERMEALDKFVKNELDHEDVLERNIETNEPLTHPDTGAALTQSVPKLPYQINGVEIEPNYGHRYLAALWGDDEKATRGEQAGLTHGVVSMIIARMGAQFDDWKRKREARDSKSR